MRKRDNVTNINQANVTTEKYFCNQSKYESNIIKWYRNSIQTWRLEAGSRNWCNDLHWSERMTLISQGILKCLRPKSVWIVNAIVPYSTIIILGKICSNLSTKKKIPHRTNSVFKSMLVALVFLSFLILKKDN